MASQSEDTKVPDGEQSTPAGPPRTPVQRLGVPSRTSVLLSPINPSRTRLLQSEGSSKVLVGPKEAPSRTRVPLSESHSKTPMSPSEVPSRILLSRASTRTQRTPRSPGAASIPTLLPPSQQASSVSLWSPSETSVRSLGPPSEAPSEVQMPPKATSSQMSWDPRGSWLIPDESAEHASQEAGLPGPSEEEEDSSPSTPVMYFGFINNYLKSEKPTTAVKGLIDMTMEVMKLDHQVKETEIQQKVVRNETEMLLNEKLPIRAETKVMLANLNYKTREYRRELENEWSTYVHESAETQHRPPELLAPPPLARPPPEPPTAAAAPLEPLLRQQLEASKKMTKIWQRQTKELQALQEELKNTRAQTAARAQARYLQEKALLEKQLTNLAPDLQGARKENKLKSKALALEAAAERCAAELHRLLAEDRSLPTENTHGASPQSQEGKTPKSWLQIQKQQLK